MLQKLEGIVFYEEKTSGTQVWAQCIGANREARVTGAQRVGEGER